MSTHVALGNQMFTRSEQFLHRFMPIFHRLIIHLYNDMPNDCRADAFVARVK